MAREPLRRTTSAIFALAMALLFVWGNASGAGMRLDAGGAVNSAIVADGKMNCPECSAMGGHDGECAQLYCAGPAIIPQPVLTDPPVPRAVYKLASAVWQEGLHLVPSAPPI
jgi:hypothetical protein